MNSSITPLAAGFVIAATLGTATESFAETLTFEAVGTVTVVIFPDMKGAPLPFKVGDDYRLVYEFDPDTVGTSGGARDFVSYMDAVVSLSVNVGTYFATAGPAGIGVLAGTRCASPLFIFNSYGFTGSSPNIDGPDIAGLPLEEIVFGLTDTTCAKLTTTDLHLTPPDLADFTSVSSFLNFRFPLDDPDPPSVLTGHVRGEITVLRDITSINSVVALLDALVTDVISLNSKNGIINSLDAKLSAGLGALDDANENNDIAALNALESFINAVEAQRGTMIEDSDATSLIGQAEAIIAALTNL